MHYVINFTSLNLNVLHFFPAMLKSYKANNAYFLSVNINITDKYVFNEFISFLS